MHNIYKPIGSRTELHKCFQSYGLFVCLRIRNRPDIRLNPDPAGYPASISGSGSGSGFKNFAGFFAGYFIFKMYFLNLEMHIFRHILTRILEIKTFFPRLWKTKTIFSANNEQSSMKRGEKWFSEKLRKNLYLENFRSDSRLILDTYLLYRELPLPSSCCKGEACLPRSH